MGTWGRSGKSQEQEWGEYDQTILYGILKELIKNITF